MFGIGSGELVVIALVALVVLGPERLPRAARFAGLWVRRARAHWYSVKAELERELAAEELKRSLHAAERSIADAGTRLRDASAQVKAGARDLAADIGSSGPKPRPASAQEEPPGDTTR